MTDQIQQNSRVTLHFTLTLPDGTVVDTTGSGDPVTFTLGTGAMIEGLELSLLGLSPGDHQEIGIPPETGYGFPDPAAIQKMPRSDFDENIIMETGMIMSFDLPDGEEIPGTITNIAEDEITVDFNHPLAGMEVTFTVDIIDVTNPRGDA